MVNDDPQNEDARLGGKRPKKIYLPPTDAPSKSSKFTPAIFNFIALAFILYGLYSFLQKGGDAGLLSTLNQQMALVETNHDNSAIDKLETAMQMPGFSNLIPDKRPAVLQTTLQEGKGDSAICGQTITYRLIEGYGENQKISKTRSLQLGSSRIPLGITRGIEGMKVGEVRQLTVPPTLQKTQDQLEDVALLNTQITIELVSISPQLPEAQLPIRRFVARSSSGLGLQCGDIAPLNMAIWSNTGELLFDNRNTDPAYFIIGQNHMPYGVERGVTQMAPGGLYTLALVPDYLAPLAKPFKAAEPLQSTYKMKPFPADFKWPTDMVLIDISYPEKLESNRLPEAPMGVTPTPENLSPPTLSPTIE